MSISVYLQNLRSQIGTALVLMPGVSAIVRDPAGRVLLHLRSDDGNWDIPGGAVDPGEAPAQALVREVWEETGLQVIPERIVGVFGGKEGYRRTYPNGDQVEYVDLLFECHIVGGRLEPRDSESIDLRFFAPDEVPELPYPYPREVFAVSSEGNKSYFEWTDKWLPSV